MSSEEKPSDLGEASDGSIGDALIPGGPAASPDAPGETAEDGLVTAVHAMADTVPKSRAPHQASGQGTAASPGRTPETAAGGTQASAIRAVPVRHYGRWISAVVVLGIVALIALAFAQSKIRYGVVWDFLDDPNIVSGMWHTLLISVLAMAIGIALGVLVAVMRMSKNPITSSVAWFYVWFFRGTPVLVQLFLWYNLAYIFPVLNLGFYKDEMSDVMTPLLAALLGLGLNEGAYMSEIVRAGIVSVDEGQTEAAYALGMTGGQNMRRIVLPQAMRVIVPPTGNEYINMLKTSSLAYAVQYQELMKATTDIYSTSLAIMEMLFVASLWYLVLTSVFSVGQFYLERRFARGSTRNLPPTPLQKVRAGVLSLRRPRVAIGGVS